MNFTALLLVGAELDVWIWIWIREDLDMVDGHGSMCGVSEFEVF